MKREKWNRPEQGAYIETRARQYARSGKHLDFRTIEALLISEGYPGARKLLGNPWTQQELNRICQQAFGPDKSPEALLRLGHSVSG
jgi:hypothetical protein